MQWRGQLYAESPIYRGNARKTLFTRDRDGQQRLVSLAGEIEGTAQSLMDAFIGQSRNGRNQGLINRLWQRLYGRPLPDGLITNATCTLQESSYPSDHFFDLRMGIKLDEDRWAAEANANYKLETILRNSIFDFTLHVTDGLLQRDGNADKLYYLLQEITAGRFWFGAGKSKGLGRCRLAMDLPFTPTSAPPIQNNVNHLTISATFDARNPIMVGWNWGKIDPNLPAFAAVEGRLLLTAMRTLPTPIRERLELTIGGPIRSAANWKERLNSYLPRATAIWLREQSVGQAESWTLSADAVARLGKDKKYPLAKKVLQNLHPLTNSPFPTYEAAETAITHAMADKANMVRRVLNVLVKEERSAHTLNEAAWQEVAAGLNLDPALGQQLAAQIDDEGAFTATIAQACLAILPQLEQQIDQQIRLLQSDNWVEVEIAMRQEHLKIKEMIRDNQIRERDWDNFHQAPEGVTPAAWRDFLDSHRRVSFGHMRNPGNLNKSITNDLNFIEFLQRHRDKARQELAQPKHTEFRAGGRSGREVAQRHGNPYDTIFMRMLTWKPSARAATAWEVYIPGSTLKGAFRKRASQILKTLWGEGRRTADLLDWLFGKQGQVGRIFFSDAYLVDPDNTDSAWCSMDGIRIDPKSGQPIEGAKMDFLYAYGEQLKFRLRLDLQDLGEPELDAWLLLQHLLRDFAQGDIPLGGAKTSGMGWVQVDVDEVTWLTANANGVTRQLFPQQPVQKEGLWQTVKMEGPAAAALVKPTRALSQRDREVAALPPRAEAGFISHRAFGGYCGTLHLEAEVLRPLHIQESGQPAQSTMLDGEPVNGWDHFSMSPPALELRPEQRVYALPARSLKGMLRHLYAIASDSHTTSKELSNLNPVDSLFGWVGTGQNQAIMGRLAVSFGKFSDPQLAWFKVPHFYGNLRYVDGQWQQLEEAHVAPLVIADRWRLFPHAPLAPVVERLANFTPDIVNAHYLRAVLPGAKAQFTVRFWNLEEVELQRLIWCLTLEDGLAHKLGKHRYLGFGTLRVRALPESYLIDWNERYDTSALTEGKQPLDRAQWHNPRVVQHHAALRAALTAGVA